MQTRAIAPRKTRSFTGSSCTLSPCVAPANCQFRSAQELWRPHGLAPRLPEIVGGQLYGDKAYCDSSMKDRLAENQNLEILTPVKKKKGFGRLSSVEKLFTEAVSRMRQPIESLFNWIDDKTGIQRALRCAPIGGCWCMSSDDSPPRCFCSPLTLNWHCRLICYHAQQQKRLSYHHCGQYGAKYMLSIMVEVNPESFLGNPTKN